MKSAETDAANAVEKELMEKGVELEADEMCDSASAVNAGRIDVKADEDTLNNWSTAQAIEEEKIEKVDTKF